MIDTTLGIVDSQMLVDSLAYFVQFSALLLSLFFVFSALVQLSRDFLGEARLRRMLEAGKVRGYLGGLALGAVSPFCACSTLPLLKGLYRAGAPFGPTIAFMLASPTLNIAVVGIFLVLFGPMVTVSYVALMLLFAVSTALLWDTLGFSRHVRIAPEASSTIPMATDADEQAESAGCCTAAESAPRFNFDSNLTVATEASSCCEEHPPASACCSTSNQAETAWMNRGRWSRAYTFGRDEVRRALPYVLVGAAVASLLNGFVPREWILSIAGPANPLAVPAAAVLGAPLYLTTESAAAIGFGLLEGGAVLGAVMALIVGGSSTSIPELLLLRDIFRGRLIGIYIATSLVVATVTGFAFNLMF